MLHDGGAVRVSHRLGLDRVGDAEAIQHALEVRSRGRAIVDERVGVQDGLLESLGRRDVRDGRTAAARHRDADAPHGYSSLGIDLPGLNQGVHHRRWCDQHVRRLARLDSLAQHGGHRHRQPRTVTRLPSPGWQELAQAELDRARAIDLDLRRRRDGCRQHDGQ
jgi:hypothetical protein